MPSRALPVVIQPFPLDFERYDLHVMLYFEGHPRYEAVEGMILSGADQPPLIRAILTRHDQGQVHYLNDQTSMARTSALPRAAQYTAMKYEHRVESGRPQARLSFRTIEGEQVEMDLVAVGEPSPKYAGLADPGGHAATSSLPIMYRESSTLAHPDSTIRIDGRDYQIPRKVWVPIFFTGMKGFYSANFSHGVLYAFPPQPVTVEGVPAELVPGAEWRYRRGDQLVSYTVEAVDANRVVLQGPRERVSLERIGNQLGLVQVERQASDGRSSLRLRFAPPMPLLGGNGGGYWQGRFSVGISDHDELLRGRISYCRQADADYLLLQPESPEWATARPLQLVLRADSGQAYLSGEIAGSTNEALTGPCQQHGSASSAE